MIGDPGFRCATCVFFSPFRPLTPGGRPSARGQCRCHAPTLDRDEGGLRTVWPMVHEDSFCGDHAQIEPLVEPQEPERQIAIVEQPRPVEIGDWWRCLNCNEITVSPGDAPDRCLVCRCQNFTKVPALEPPADLGEDRAPTHGEP